MKEMELNTQPEVTTKKKTPLSAYVWAVIGLVYAISPLDILPDVPVIGWVDDFFVLAATWLNLFEQQSGEGNQTLSHVLKYAKWAAIGIGIVAVLLILVLGATLVNLFTK